MRGKRIVAVLITESRRWSKRHGHGEAAFIGDGIGIVDAKEERSYPIHFDRLLLDDEDGFPNPPSAFAGTKTVTVCHIANANYDHSSEIADSANRRHKFILRSSILRLERGSPHVANRSR